MTTPVQLSAFMPSAAAERSDTAGAAYTDINGLESLKQKNPKDLSQVAQQVEALFLQMMLKSMRDASPEGGLFDSNEGKLYQDMLDKQVSIAMAKHQSMGLGDLLMRQLQRSMAGDAGDAASSTVGAGLTGVAAPIAPGAVPVPLAAPITSAASSGFRPASPAQFAQAIFPGIRKAAAKYGLSAEGMLAQAALESGWGQRIARNADGSSSFNLFGVKTGSGWAGASTAADTVEFDGVVARRTRETFRSYDSFDAAIDDYARVLGSSARYDEVRAAGADPHRYAHALGASGYATDPQYGAKLSQLLASDIFQSALSPRLAVLQK